ncbi:MAG: methylated-DNA--[protein]-cysteine S-methyltransferase [Porticoccaceae bacterium]
MIYFATLPSPVGALTIGADDTGITAIAFPGEMPTVQGVANPSPLIREAVRQLRAYFAGRLTNFELPLNAAGTVFQKTVWQALLAVPYGATASYGEIATAVDNPRGARAVGLANGRNPIAIVVPCHRIIGRDGSLTGYGGGLDRKRWLLAHEQRGRQG